MAARSARREFRALLAGAKYPARSPDVNVADIKAQVAANEKGVQELRSVVAQFGWPTVSAYMRHVMDNAEECVRRVIDRHRQRLVRLHAWTTASRLRVAITVDHASAHRGGRFHRHRRSSDDGNFNSPPAVTRRRCCTCSAAWSATTFR